MLVKSAIHVADLQDAAVSERVGQLEQALSGLNRKGPRPVVKVVPGKPFVEVIREVLRSKTGLLVLPAGKKRSPGQPLFGSTEMHLIRKCPCPVSLVKPTRRQRYRRIMAAVDIDREDSKNAALSSRIMEVAASLAKMEGSELQIVHAWKLFGENTMSSRVGLIRDEEAGLSRKFRSERQDWLFRLAEKHAPGTPPDRIHLVKGDAAELIPAAASREKIELIVMGTVGRTGLAGFFIGNTAETILQHVDCSVLALKPQGFVTPVRL
jgi:nucleotide-binding universal stress UspA family protein